MKNKTYTKKLSVRLSPMIINNLQRLSAKAGITKSEYLRKSIQDDYILTFKSNNNLPEEEI